ncbi:WD40 domain protein [Pelomyxa schiedti]|nr:WD40 domain protein [Pelomyxa schiedti]
MTTPAMATPTPSATTSSSTTTPSTAASATMQLPYSHIKYATAGGGQQPSVLVAWGANFAVYSIPEFNKVPCGQCDLRRGFITAVGFSGNLIATATEDKQILLWSHTGAQWEYERTIKTKKKITAIEILSHHVIFSDKFGEVYVADVDRLRALANVPPAEVVKTASPTSTASAVSPVTPTAVNPPPSKDISVTNRLAKKLRKQQQQQQHQSQKVEYQHQKPAIKLAIGHCSLVTSLACMRTDTTTLVATCDRDERIRVSRFPQTCIIESFCMGHTEFISDVVFCGSTILVSGAGDGTLRSWDPLTGKCLCIQYLCQGASGRGLPPPGTKPSVVKPQSYRSGLLAATVEGVPQLFVFVVTSDGQLALAQSIDIGGVPTAASFSPFDNSLLVSLIPESPETPLLKAFKPDSTSTWQAVPLPAFLNSTVTVTEKELKVYIKSQQQEQMRKVCNLKVHKPHEPNQKKSKV